MAVPSAGPYESLHLAPDRQPQQYLIPHFFTDRILFLTPNRWRGGVVVSGVRRMNEVDPRREGLVPGRVTV